MEAQTLRELYVDELKDIFSAESQILQALPKMVQSATAPNLKKGFQDHLEQSRGHVQRLEQIFKELDEKPGNKKCKGMEGLLKEGEEVMTKLTDPEVRDAALISAAQRVEHYEMAAYGTVRTYAKTLGEREASQTLQTTLDEEGETDKKLTRLAEHGINVKAMNA